MSSLFSCPLCSAPLSVEGGRYLCPAGHCFDRAASGYVHLLPANRKHSQNPGDDREMVAARAAFLEKGYYSPLLELLARITVEETAHLPLPVLLDSGCGEGYYTAGVYRALCQAGRSPRIAGVDLSKYALRRAAKQLPEGEFAVASVYRLPIAADSVDVLLNVFSPLATSEFARVLRPGGLFCYVVPSARHLWEMKQILYSQPYENPVKREEYSDFLFEGMKQVRYTLSLTQGQDIMALFHMTPYAWKTPKEGIRRLESLSCLKCQIGFDIHLYRKNS